MKKHTIIAALIAAAWVGGTSAETPYPQATPETSPGPRCKAQSWNPEQYTFYGEKKVTVEKLGNIPTRLSDHRMFLQVTQGKSSADVKFYEQEKDGTSTVTEWTTKETSTLLDKIDRAIVANEGVDCVGKQLKGVLRKELGNGKVTNGVTVPDSPQAAFGPSVDQASGDFIKSTLIILC
jgi:hypothetical protein